MDTERMIRNLEKVEEDHKDDKVFTGQLNIADMVRDVRKRLEELKPYEDTDLPPQQIKDMQFCLREKSRECAELRGELQELKERDTAKAPKKAEEQPYLRKHFHSYTCPVCYKKIEMGWKFCGHCGQRLKREEN